MVYYYSAFILPVRITGINDLGKWGMIGRGLETALLLAVSTTVALIICVRPFVTEAIEARQSGATYHVTHIQKSIQEMRDSIGKSQTVLSEASDSIARSLDDLNSLVTTKADEVQALNSRLTALQSEVEYLRSVASLTQLQADAATHALSRNKWVDYIIGFLIGIMSSATFSIVAAGVRQLRIKRSETNGNRTTE